jgi:hypothetical protein
VKRFCTTSGRATPTTSRIHYRSDSVVFGVLSESVPNKARAVTTVWPSKRSYGRKSNRASKGGDESCSLGPLDATSTPPSPPLTQSIGENWTASFNGRRIRACPDQIRGLRRKACMGKRVPHVKGAFPRLETHCSTSRTFARSTRFPSLSEQLCFLANFTSMRVLHMKQR